MRTLGNDDDDLLELIQQGGKAIEKAVQIPTCEGRNQAGWITLQNLKVQPEVMTMLEQLREHRMFRGMWKTSSQVAWSMIYLGVRAVNHFFSTNEQEWETFRSAYMTYSVALAEWAKEERQKTLHKAADIFKRLYHEHLDKGTAFGRYRAYTILEKAVNARSLCDDQKRFDLEMYDAPSDAQVALLYDTRISDVWHRLYPTAGGELKEEVMDVLQIDMCEEYFEEQDKARREPED